MPTNPSQLSAPLTQSTGASFSSLVNTLMNIINNLVWLLGGVALLVFLYGIVRFVSTAGNAKGHAEGYKMMLWGLVALFVFVSLWGIISLFCNTIFGAAGQCVGTNVFPNTSSGVGLGPVIF